MGKRLIAQRRGKGSLTFAAKLKGYEAKYINQPEEELLKGDVTAFIKETGRNSIIAEITFNDRKSEKIIAAEGLVLGQQVQQGKGADIKVGNVAVLGDVPEGCPIFGIEKVSGDGGSMIKSAGSYALLITKDSRKAIIKLPSNKMVSLPLNSRATIGNISCGGRTEKPFVKAGNKFHAMRAKRKFYPWVRGVAMNAVDHPFGGAQHHPGKSKSTSRNAPPGRKVGAIGSKRTGRRKKN